MAVVRDQSGLVIVAAASRASSLVATRALGGVVRRRGVAVRP
jgi:hypothetical protein